MDEVELIGHKGRPFTLTVESEHDTAYLKIRDVAIAETLEVSGELNVDFDDKGNVVGVEILRGDDNHDDGEDRAGVEEESQG